MVIFDDTMRYYKDQESGLTFAIVSNIPDSVKGDIVLKIGHFKNKEIDNRLNESGLLLSVSNISFGDDEDIDDSEQESSEAKLTMDTRWYLKNRPLMEEFHQDKEDLEYVTEGIDDEDFQKAFSELFMCIIRQSVEHAERMLKEKETEI